MFYGMNKKVLQDAIIVFPEFADFYLQRQTKI